MNDLSDVSKVATDIELSRHVATIKIRRAVRGRKKVARGYILWLRRLHPDATPAEVIAMLERHYVAATTSAGAIVAVGSLVADVGISLIPAGSAAGAGVKAAALAGAKVGAQKAAALLPAGDKQLQFEITALFGLALADIHGLRLDSDQAQVLVYGLTNGKLSQSQIAEMALHASRSHVIRRPNLSNPGGSTQAWAETLSNALSGSSAKGFLETLQDAAPGVSSLGGKKKAALNFGMHGVASGITKFRFGRDVVSASHSAFPPTPSRFPAHLSVKSMRLPFPRPTSRALEALKSAAGGAGTRLRSGAGAAGTNAGAAMRAAGSLRRGKTPSRDL